MLREKGLWGGLKTVAGLVWIRGHRTLGQNTTSRRRHTSLGVRWEDLKRRQLRSGSGPVRTQSRKFSGNIGPGTCYIMCSEIFCYNKYVCILSRIQLVVTPPGFSVHGIFQARILEWVAMSSSRGSSWPRDWTHVSCVSCIGRQIHYHLAIWEAHVVWSTFSEMGT